jgi:hypothetical protein
MSETGALQMRPTGLHSRLFELAKEAAERSEEDCARLRAEIAELQKRQAELQAELAKSQGATDRSLRFEPMIGNVYQCPICWTADEAKADLAPIPSNTDEDLFRCTRCHNKFSFEA